MDTRSVTFVNGQVIVTGGSDNNRTTPESMIEALQAIGGAAANALSFAGGFIFLNADIIIAGFYEDSESIYINSQSNPNPMITATGNCDWTSGEVYFGEDTNGFIINYSHDHSSTSVRPIMIDSQNTTYPGTPKLTWRGCRMNFVGTTEAIYIIRSISEDSLISNVIFSNNTLESEASSAKAQLQFESRNTLSTRAHYTLINMYVRFNSDTSRSEFTLSGGHNRGRSIDDVFIGYVGSALSQNVGRITVAPDPDRSISVNFLFLEGLAGTTSILLIEDANFPTDNINIGGQNQLVILGKTINVQLAAAPDVDTEALGLSDFTAVLIGETRPVGASARTNRSGFVQLIHSSVWQGTGAGLAGNEEEYAAIPPISITIPDNPTLLVKRYDAVFVQVVIDPLDPMVDNLQISVELDEGVTITEEEANLVSDRLVVSNPTSESSTVGMTGDLTMPEFYALIKLVYLAGAGTAGRFRWRSFTEIDSNGILRRVYENSGVGTIRTSGRLLGRSVILRTNGDVTASSSGSIEVFVEKRVSGLNLVSYEITSNKDLYVESTDGRVALFGGRITQSELANRRLIGELSSIAFPRVAVASPCSLITALGLSGGTESATVDVTPESPSILAGLVDQTFETMSTRIAEIGGTLSVEVIKPPDVSTATVFFFEDMGEISLLDVAIILQDYNTTAGPRVVNPMDSFDGHALVLASTINIGTRGNTSIVDPDRFLSVRNASSPIFANGNTINVIVDGRIDEIIQYNPTDFPLLNPVYIVVNEDTGQLLNTTPIQFSTDTLQLDFAASINQVSVYMRSELYRIIKTTFRPATTVGGVIVDGPQLETNVDAGVSTGLLGTEIDISVTGIGTPQASFTLTFNVPRNRTYDVELFKRLLFIELGQDAYLQFLASIGIDNAIEIWPDVIIINSANVRFILPPGSQNTVISEIPVRYNSNLIRQGVAAFNPFNGAQTPIRFESGGVADNDVNAAITDALDTAGLLSVNTFLATKDT